MRLYDEATKVKVGSEYSEEFEVKDLSGSVLSPLLFAIAVNVIEENISYDKENRKKLIDKFRLDKKSQSKLGTKVW